ncbi:MAG: hypothetical protein EBU90_12280 [Proteobacteria bacterium]|nr:hypothetical protein [Pseudomonadota bacterium]
MRVWVYDLETLDIFTASFIDRDSDETRVFVISKSKDEREELFRFLKEEVSGLIGYNNINFDGQVIEYMFRNPKCTPQDIRRYAQIITSEDNRKPDVPEWAFRIPQLDLFRALSLSTKAKRVGLKWCEFMMDLENIEDMPSQGEGENWEEMVLSYNLNDVIATKELYTRFKHEVELRKAITLRDGVNVMNSTEPDMAKKLFGKYLSNAMRIPLNDLRSMSTNRDVVHVKDIIFPYVNFNKEIFHEVLRHFQSLSLKNKDNFEKIINYKGIPIVYGLGGIHAAPKNRIFESNEKRIIKSLDVVSFYPNLMIRNNLCPAHLPKDVFLPLYEGFFNERRSIPKSDPRNYILKILLNSTYGLTNDEYSFLRDRAVTLSICINGQLLLTMLLEMLAEKIPLELVMMNTDGFEVSIPREYEESYSSICKEWEQLTNLELEFENYNKLIISDVNNYIGIYTNGKTKTKGKYEFKDIPLHKNKSHAIIPYSVFNYWVNGIPIEETIKNHRNIFDFCAGVKAKFSSERGYSSYELHKVNISNLEIKKLSKTVRYYICGKNHDGYLMKRYSNGIIEQVEAPSRKGRIFKDWKVKYFNKYFEPKNFTDYNIDYQYYIMKANEWVSEFNEKQLFISYEV